MSNLRSRPIDGYITDNAGNIVRNSEIIIKEETPTSSTIVDTVTSNDSGYFVSKPIKNGLYSIYESNVLVYRHYHSVIPTSIQCYAPDYPSGASVPLNLKSFSQFVNSATPAYDINYYRRYIQVEPETMDVTNDGSMFPIWDVAPITFLSPSSFANMNQIHPEISNANNSRLTHTRFDAEYFSPLDSQNTLQKRIRWAGIPGVRFYANSKIVLPLDYYSILPTNPIVWSQYGFANNVTFAAVTPEIIQVKFGDPSMALPQTTDLFNKTNYGDIIELNFNGWGDNLKFFFILTYKEYVADGGATRFDMYGRMWKSVNTTHAAMGITTVYDLMASPYTVTNIRSVKLYPGMFAGMENITSSTSEFFTVMENLYAQNNPEIYNYTTL